MANIDKLLESNKELLKEQQRSNEKIKELQKELAKEKPQVVVLKDSPETEDNYVSKDAPTKKFAKKNSVEKREHRRDRLDEAVDTANEFFQRNTSDKDNQ